MHATLLLAAFLALSLSMPATANDAHATTSTPTPVPAAPAWLAEVEALYDADLRVAGLEDRTFAPEHWWQIATPLLSSRNGFAMREIGRSAEERPLRHVSWGRGKTRVLLWSQMHGDESTATMALADLFRFLGEHPRHPIVQRLRERTTLHFFPIVNPDGAARFQRRNAQGVDVNRDARDLATPEGQALKALHDALAPDFGFNLHDQRPGYRAGDSERGVAVALLAPAYNEANDVNEVRGRAMEVAGMIRAALEPSLSGHLARWDETFNPRGFGDMTTHWGSSTVLLEAGGIEGDPQKQLLRKHTFIAMLAGLDSIASGSHAGVPHGVYRELPENGAVWPDLAIRGGTVVSDRLPPVRADVMVGFRHPLAEQGGTISDVGDLADSPSRHSIDASGLYLVPIADAEGRIAHKRIVTGAPAHFHLSRDPEGRDIVWTLKRDVDPAHPRP
ncbi:M14 family zinc carboxypeptidase [Luteimonas aestuarii]|nr:M14 family zinc carboxypeptidase [Luteimonas aestuarii]